MNTTTLSSVGSQTSCHNTPALNCFTLIGGGTAGCVLANRLSANPDRTVLLVERGPAVDSWISRVPLLSASLDGSPLTTKIQSVVDLVTGGPIDIFQGNGLGGATLINHMFYTRGPAGQYDSWEKNGAEGWGSKAILPHFTKSENVEYNADPRAHGTEGCFILFYTSLSLRLLHRRMEQPS